MGWEGGTHTRSHQRWNEIPLKEVTIGSYAESVVEVDVAADYWLGARVFEENVKGILRGVLATIYLSFTKFFQNCVPRKRKK
jgi:hypothetical protein